MHGDVQIWNVCKSRKDNPATYEEKSIFGIKFWTPISSGRIRICSEETEDAIVILQKCNPQSFEQKEVLERRLFVLNDDGEEIVDMSDDDFDDDFGDDDDDLDETVLETSPQSAIEADDVFEESDPSYDFAPVATEESVSVDNSPKSIDQLLELAQKAKKGGDSDKAIQYFSDILDLDPTHDIATQEIVNLMSGGGGFDDDIDPDDFGVIEDTSPVVKESSTGISQPAFFTTSSQLSKGMGYVFVGMFDEARRVCSGTDLGLVVTAITYLEEGNLRKAKELQGFIDNASNRQGIVYCENFYGSWQKYTRDRKKYGSCKKALAEMKETNPNYRNDECECLLDALEMLD